MESTGSGKTVLITGATSGIGQAAARAMAGQGYRVVVLSRNPLKCAATAQELRTATANESVYSLPADLASLESVRAAAAEFLREHDRLDVLVNNAGVSPSRRRPTADGFEHAFGLNHLGHFLLTNLLLERLKASAPARVISVSSNIYKQAKLEFDNLQLERGFSAMRAYANSKLANLLFTTELARRLAGTGVTANAMTPGMVKTNIGQEEGWLYALAKRLADAFGGKSPEQGADTLVWLATAPELAGVTGKYFQDRAELPMENGAGDPELAARLWQASERLVGLQKPGN
jgi:NAD(P)-dependent dehydrogenase (short-subunit alcohol dehydrogenase family)